MKIAINNRHINIKINNNKYKLNLNNLCLDNLYLLLIYLILIFFFISGCSSKSNKFRIYENNNKLNKSCKLHKSLKDSNNSINKNLSNVKVVWSKDNGNMYVHSQDKGPIDYRDIPNLSLVPDAVPKYEPKSRYGNPYKYKIFNKVYKVLPTSKGFKERGYASWYGSKFHGYRTSNGEIYDMYKMTAAHKTLPLPTYLKVVNLQNRRSVIVKVNDRGPFHGDRILDLSYAAASKLGFIDRGVGKVEIIAINPSTEDLTLKSNSIFKQPINSKLNNDLQHSSSSKFISEVVQVPNSKLKSSKFSNNFIKNSLYKNNKQNSKHINNQFITPILLSKTAFQIGAFSIKENATKLVAKCELLLKNNNLLKDKHYQIDIVEVILNNNLPNNLQNSTEKNILYKVVINFKSDMIDYKKFNHLLLHI